ncbi:MAG: alpha/beta hydrolase [Myxococcota bacterium]
MRPIPVEERRLASFDGTEIAYHIVGEGPPILLGNGLGGSWKAWSHQIAYLMDRYRFISWDYRGLYRSGTPLDDPEALRVEVQAMDALAILEAEQVDRVAMLGWSMGVQVGLELYRAAPERVASLVLINGVAGRPWESLMNLRQMRHVVPGVLRTVRRLHPVAEAVTARVASWPETVTWAKRVGLASHTLDDELWHELAVSFTDLDMEVYMRTLELLGEHDAFDLLAGVDVPTLIVAGDRDLMTPRRIAEKMMRTIPEAELMLVPGGTHYVAVEYPELVNLRIEKFFRERGFPSPRDQA